MDVLDFVLAMNLLARIIYDKKLKMLFELCDDDEDVDDRHKNNDDSLTKTRMKITIMTNALRTYRIPRRILSDAEKI